MTASAVGRFIAPISIVNCEVQTVNFYKDKNRNPLPFCRGRQTRGTCGSELLLGFF